ncbi:MAG: DUF4458 domain-containing protein [Candidatus Cryptobacteroides sp.]
MNIKNLITNGLLVLLAFVTFAGCAKDIEEPSSGDYGYVQFKITKASAVSKTVDTKAGNSLELLSDATKLRVRLRAADGFVLEQTLIVTPVDTDKSEWGVWTEKLKLYKGSWTLLGYEIFGGLDESLLTGEPSGQTVIDVVPGGLVRQDVYVDVRPYGYADIEFVKRLPEVKAAAGEGYRLDAVKKADISIRHQDGDRYNIQGVATKVKYLYDESENNDYNVSSKLVCDTTLFLRAGTYTVEGYTVYDKNNRIIEALPTMSTVPVEERKFTVVDNGRTTANVPITFTETSPIILDGIALKKLWEALDGPNWSYAGRYENKGCNWDFNRDVDLWTAQPGVQVLENGRVASISFSGFGAKGEIPEGIFSQLTEIRNLTFGFHDDFWGDTPGYEVDDPSAMDTDAIRSKMKEDFRRETPLAGMAKEMREYLPSDLKKTVERSLAMKQRRASVSTKATPHETYSTYITKLPDDIGELKNLNRLFIANSPIKALPDRLADLDKLTDIEIYNCSQMEEFPMVLSRLKNLQMLYFVRNQKIPAQSLYNGLDALAKGEYTKDTFQGLYFMYNNLERVPASMTEIKKLSFIDFSDNYIEVIEKAFGKKHNLRTVGFANNRLKSIPSIPEPDGSKWFAGVEAVETWDFSGNELTELPNIFDANEPFYMGTVNFSQNKISSIEDADSDYRGVNAEIVDLSYNRLEEFPECIYNSPKGEKYSSKINYIILRGNGMKEFSTKALEGKNTIYTQSMDLSFNRLKAMPGNFHAVTFPYMYGLDLTANAFTGFPYIVLDISKLTILMVRSQRDDDGYRSMSEWPARISAHKGLSVLYLGGNDIGKVKDGTLQFIRFSFEITDNPRLSIDLSPLAPYIRMGLIGVLYDEDQDVRGL